MTRNQRLSTRIAIGLVAAALLAAGLALAPQGAPAARAAAKAAACAGDNGGITLSPGFCATVFADNVGNVRHLVVAPDGVVYANTWSGTYYFGAKTPPGGFLIALRDTHGDGHADQITRFGPGKADGVAGGTGIALYHGALYATG